MRITSQEIGRPWTVEWLLKSQAVDIVPGEKRCINETDGFRCRSILKKESKHDECLKCRGVDLTKATPEEVLIVLALHEQGYSVNLIANLTNTPPSTARMWINKARDEG